MNFKLLASLLFVVLIGSFGVQAQGTFRDRFEEGNLLMEDHLYKLALPVWLDLLKEDPDNSNINFKAGYCHFKTSVHRADALPYFQKAVAEVSKNFDPFMHTERGSKVDAWYYLGRTYHLNYQFDEAIQAYTTFSLEAGKKHFLQAAAAHEIEICNYAKELVNAPINVKIKNMGDKINSEYPDYAPVLSLDETAIYYTSRRLRADSSNLYYKEVSDGMYYENIYASYIEGDVWTEPELLNFNKLNDHTASVSLSGDGQTLFVFLDNDGDGNLYKSEIMEEHWSIPEKLGSDINSKSMETHVSVSPDGKTLYFVSDRKGGLGGRDIYTCSKLPNGDWSLAKNLGAPINTKYDEEGPFIHPDGKTLYFASNGHQTMGGFDIFFSEFEEETGVWGTPFNIGYPINTTDDDAFYITNPSGKRAYYSSAKDGGLGDKDIYSIEMVGAEEKKLTLLKGFISVPEGQDVPDGIMIFVTDNETGEEVGRYIPHHKNGSFAAILTPGRNYNFSYDLDGTEFYNENIFIPFGSEYQEISKEVRLNPIDLSGGTIVTNDDAPSTLKQWKVRLTTLDSQNPGGIKVNYVDEAGNVVFTETIGSDGFFKYHNLPKESPYLMRLISNDKALCDSLEITLIENHKETKKLIQTKDCDFIVSPEPYWKLENLSSVPSNLKVKVMDESGNLLYTEVVSPDGSFHFKPLPIDKKYMMEIVSEDASLCDKALIKLVNTEYQLVLTPEGGCKFVSHPTQEALVRNYQIRYKKGYDKLPPDGLVINFLDEHDNVILSDITDKKGTFAYSTISSSSPTIQLFAENDEELQKMEIVLFENGKELAVLNFDHNSLFSMKLDDTKLTTGKVTDVLSGETFYTEYFGYNKNVPSKESEFASAVSKIVDLINSNGSVTIAIESSASNVPTKTYKTNDALTKLRAETAKEKLFNELKSKGVDTSKVIIRSVSTLVQGPKYKGDFATNKATYEKYQYVKVFAK